MKRNHFTIIPALIMLLPLVSVKCARDDVAIVRIQLENMPKSTAMNSDSIVSRVFSWIVPSAWAQWDYPNTDLQVILTAPDLEDVVFKMPNAVDSAVTIEVPSGAQRKITVYGFQDYGEGMDKTWGGHAEVDLNPGDVRDVTINMLPFITIWNAYSEGETIAYIEWGAVSDQAPIYDIQGYHIYKSDTGLEGSFVRIGTENGILASSFYDLNVVNGVTYYYKVSVFTNNNEGELSDIYEYLHLSPM